jgi:hypothetical protein
MLSLSADVAKRQVCPGDVKELIMTVRAIKTAHNIKTASRMLK